MSQILKLIALPISIILICLGIFVKKGKISVLQALVYCVTEKSALL